MRQSGIALLLILVITLGIMVNLTASANPGLYFLATGTAAAGGAGAATTRPGTSAAGAAATSSATSGVTSAAATSAASAAAGAPNAPAVVSSTTTGVAANPPSAVRSQRAEIRFMGDAMDTNQKAVDISNDCLIKAQTADVRALCQHMSESHSNDILQLHDMLMSEYQIDYLPTSLMTMQKMGLGGTQSAATMNATASAGVGLSGPGISVSLNNQRGSYDAAWLEAMTDVHQEIIQSGVRVLNFNISPRLRAFVQQSSTTALTEIRQMQTLLARIGNQ